LDKEKTLKLSNQKEFFNALHRVYSKKD